MAFSKTIFNGASNIFVAEGQQYLINGYIYVNDDPVNNDDLVRLLYKPITYSVSDLDTFSEVTANSPKNTWIESSTIFTAIETGDIKIGLYQEYLNEGTNTTGYCDSLTIKGPLDILTEKKTIIYDTQCLYKNFHVKFLDSLGGYSYWTFRTYRDNGVQFNESITIKRNIFNNFPNTFKNTQVQTDFVGVESKDTITLRAENLTEQQAIDLFELVRSVRVYDINDINKPKVLLVDKNSVNITQGEKLYNLTFNATSTFDNYRQRQ